MINKDDYIMRIQLATPARLVVINYELIEAFLLEALKALEAPESLKALEVLEALNVRTTEEQNEQRNGAQGGERNGLQSGRRNGAQSGTRNKALTVFESYVDKAKNGLTQLIRGLNFDISFSQDLYQIYRYIEKLLNTAFFTHSREAAAEALSLIQILLKGWREAAESETKNEQPAAGGAPQVYAGLTYARDGLAEYVVQDDQRGFKV